MDHFLTRDVFRGGLNKYLTNFTYQNAVQDDLWAFLNAEAASLNVSIAATVKEIMDTWTLQTGYPVVNAERKGHEVLVEQVRFGVSFLFVSDVRLH